MVRVSGPSRLTTDIDFDRDGRQTSFLRLPYSSNTSGYGWIPIPIACLKNGRGRTLLLVGGNHGDEYEGPIALANLIRGLDPGSLKGRIIVMPAANFPAVMAGRRLSPIDAGNLNRSFPGDRDGTPTRMIAHYLESVLLPMADVLLDLHSGGASLLYLPTTLIKASKDARRSARLLALARAFGLPHTIIGSPAGATEDRTLEAAAERQGVLNLGAELAGAAMINPVSIRLAEDGIRRVLRHLGMTRIAPPDVPTRLMEIRSDAYFVYASENGLFEPAVALGDDVREGQPAG
ncbi:MAG: deacylase, partial [Alphaproteobacteria bacterium]|nr:deacylase [Alphaproteobacteria bacterium]